MGSIRYFNNPLLCRSFDRVQEYLKENIGICLNVLSHHSETYTSLVINVHLHTGCPTQMGQYTRENSAKQIGTEQKT